MRSAMSLGRLMGAALDIAAAAAAHRPAGRMDAHQAEAVRGVVVRPEPHVSVIVRFLFVIPAERVAAVLSSVRIEENPREVTPSGFNAGRGRAGALVLDHQDVKLRFADCAFVGRRKDLGAGHAVVRQDYPGFAPAARAHPI
jgi:hypothetical protein